MVKLNPLYLQQGEVSKGYYIAYSALQYLKNLSGATASSSDVRQDLNDTCQQLLLLLHQPKTPTQLRKLLNCSKQALFFQLRQLREKQLVMEETNPNDKRQRLYFLTDLGKNFLEWSSQPSVELLSRVYQQAGPEAVAGFLKIVNSIEELSKKT